MNRDKLELDFDPATFAFGENPLEWRHHDAKEGLTWRLLTLDDMARVHELWADMDRKGAELATREGRTPTRQDKPDQFKMPVVLTLVAEDNRTGEILSAFYGECVVDFTMIGTNRRVARSVQTVFPYVAMHLFPRSIRIARVLVPKRLQKHMARMLPGFRNITDLFASFVHVIRQ